MAILRVFGSFATSDFYPKYVIVSPLICSRGSWQHGCPIRLKPNPDTMQLGSSVKSAIEVAEHDPAPAGSMPGRWTSLQFSLPEDLRYQSTFEASRLVVVENGARGFRVVPHSPTMPGVMEEFSPLKARARRCLDTAEELGRLLEAAKRMCTAYRRAARFPKPPRRRQAEISCLGDFYIVHSSSRTRQGLWQHTAPVLQIPGQCSDLMLARAVRACLKASQDTYHPGLHRKRAENQIFRLARMKTWRRYRPIALVSVEESSKSYELTPLRRHGRGFGGVQYVVRAKGHTSADLAKVIRCALTQSEKFMESLR